MGDGGDGSTTPIPWAAVFDPAANARVLTAIQTRGFRAASDVISRFVNSEAGRPAPNPSGPTAEPVDVPGNTDAPADLSRFLSLWEPVAARFLDIFHAPSGEAQPAKTTAVSVDIKHGKSSGGIAFGVDRPGRATAEVWLHNSSPDELADIMLRCSELLAHDGSTVSGHDIEIAPNGIAMPGRCSRGVAVSVDVTADLPTGHYRGMVVVAGLPDVWIPITLTVR